MSLTIAGHLSKIDSALNLIQRITDWKLKTLTELLSQLPFEVSEDEKKSLEARLNQIR